MSRELDISPAAEAEIAEIWDYTASEYGPDAADDYVADLDKVMMRLLEFPLMGTDCAEVRKGYRRIRAGSYMIYYIPKERGIQIMRVLHVRRDAKRHLRD